MRKYYRALIITFFILISCKTSYEPLLIDKSFFPLEIGNKWYYNISGLDTDPILNIKEVIALKEINDKSYFLVTNTHLKYNFKDTVYYRLDNSVLFSKLPQYDERIMADFSLNENEYAYWDSKGDLKVIKKTASIMIFARPFSADYGSAVTYKRGTGIIQIVQNGIIYYQINLVKAELVN